MINRKRGEIIILKSVQVVIYLPTYIYIYASLNIILNHNYIESLSNNLIIINLDFLKFSLSNSLFYKPFFLL